MWKSFVRDLTHPAIRYHRKHDMPYTPFVRTNSLFGQSIHFQILVLIVL